MMSNNIRNNETLLVRGTVVMVELGVGEGSEQNHKRPALILSNDVCNRYSPVITVAPITSKIFKKQLPTHVYISSTDGKYPIHRDSIVMMEQIRSIDKKRICSTALFKLDDEDMLIVDEALNVQLGLNVKSNYKLVG